MRAGWVSLQGQLGVAVTKRALVGFASAELLHRHSFPDVLNEDAGTGYQRRLNPQHSLDFRRYVQTEVATTIPLAFNVRAEASAHWRLIENTTRARIEFDSSVPRILAQVDCQHRLGHLQDLAVELPFICFVGLTAREEMDVFRIINSKAKGLSTSLLDYHDAQLAEDLAFERPELFVALQLNISAESPWRRQLDLGGERTSGLTRRASLRTMQKAIREHFLVPSRILERESAESAAAVAIAFWQAVTDVLPAAWNNPRKHLLTKGVGVYALSGLMGDIYRERDSAAACTRLAFRSELAGFAQDVDWSGNGMFKGLGGESGAKEALSRLRTVRRGTNVVRIARGR
jgi:DGQHR domain-containing protein